MAQRTLVRLMELVDRAQSDDVTTALRAISHLRPLVAYAEAGLVADARAAEASWATIGGALGVSRQNVHRKYATSQAAPLAHPDPLAGLRAVASVRAAMVEIEAAQVERARRYGVRWFTIAKQLGLSKQAAHERLRRRTSR